MNDIYDALSALSKLDTGRGVLSEIVSASGSTPRGVGARMLLSPEGTFSGTVGGGAVERLAQGVSQSVMETGAAREETYSLGGGAGDVGICGGCVTIRFSPLSPGEAAAVLATLEKPPRLLLYGAGHVGKALADAMALLGISVIVTDNREGLLSARRFPNAERRLHTLDDAPIDPTGRDLVVIMTHGHAHDFVLTMRAMASSAAYIGLMASHTKADAVRRQLLAAGFSPEDIAGRLHTPIGIPIHAETPEEIAVSIAAEIIDFLRSGKNT